MSKLNQKKTKEYQSPKGQISTPSTATKDRPKRIYSIRIKNKAELRENKLDEFEKRKCFECQSLFNNAILKSNWRACEKGICSSCACPMCYRTNKCGEFFGSIKCKK